jgi:hypothetical protein
MPASRVATRKASGRPLRHAKGRARSGLGAATSRPPNQAAPPRQPPPKKRPPHQARKEHPHQTSPSPLPPALSWIESDSIRETTLQLFDPDDRAAVRRFGRVLYDLVVFATHDCGLSSEASGNRADLRAIAADLRYTGGYCAMVVARSAEVCSLDPPDEALARFAGRLARKVAALVASIEERLS